MNLNEAWRLTDTYGKVVEALTGSHLRLPLSFAETAEESDATT